MSRTIRNLFRSRRPAAPRKARLNVETFDQRLLPSVSCSVAAGTLTITGSVQVSRNSQNQIVVVDETTRATSIQSDSLVQRIRFDGGAGNDRFYNKTDKPLWATGGLGNDTLHGGGGEDVFVGSSGNDRYFGEGGKDVLMRNGYRSSFADGTAEDMVVGAVTYSATFAFAPGDGTIYAGLAGAAGITWKWREAVAQRKRAEEAATNELKAKQEVEEKLRLMTAQVGLHFVVYDAAFQLKYD
jgi:Ca2+-binding RTX toxin-like protein